LLAPNRPDLRVIQGDIRDTEKLAQRLSGQDAVLHLACISNDASFELDEKIVGHHQLRLLRAGGDCRKEGRRVALRLLLVELGRVSDSSDFAEDHPLMPLTLYNKFKGMCEPPSVEAQVRRLHRDRDPPGDDLRAKRAHEARSFSQHPDQPHGQQGHDHGVQWQQMRPNLHIEDMVEGE
jgi:hypothetical protein